VMVKHAAPSSGAIAEALALGGQLRVGVDRVELSAFTRIVRTGGAQLLRTVFTPGELDHCGSRIEKLATRFAAKEATTKMLGTGIRGLGMNEIEVLTAPHGQPSIVLSGRARERAHAVGITEIAVSLSHTISCAEAFVVGVMRLDTSALPRTEESCRDQVE
jgi:holo-[acyl-carrier protein] synthase